MRRPKDSLRNDRKMNSGVIFRGKASQASFPKYEQILVRKQEKVVLYAVRFPKAGRLAVMLFLDDDFFCRKARALENAHRLKAERLHHALLSRVAHEDGAKLTALQNTETFARYFFHFGQKIFQRQKRQIAVDILAVMDDVGIRRMRANQVNRIIGQFQPPCVAVYERYNRLSFKIESALCFRQLDCRRIYVNADKIAMRQPCLDCRRAVADKLIQNGVALLGIAQYHIARNVWRPVAVAKIPSIQSFRFREI